MKKFVKILSLIAIVFVMTLSLASCSYNFFSEYNGQGAEISTDDIKYSFEVLDADQVKTYKDDKKSFVLFIGTHTKETCVNQVKKICEEATNINYDGVFLYVDVTDALSSLSLHKEYVEKLGVKEIDDSTYGLVAACYDNGSVKWDTSNTSRYEKMLTKFTSASDNVSSGISFRAITDYVKENYYLKTINDL
ncbi:MAG: hypothetical protein J5936_01450 [Acholeplasmatales bacterium]|nr:hypothetical protein [Acholeplasmatales bacterium]